LSEFEAAAAPTSDAAVPLTGGRLTKGVVRGGDTVRRPASRASEFIARLLRHFEARGVDWAPRYLGQDDVGRDILTYLPGETPYRWGYFSDEQVGQAAKLLRAFHDATRGSELAGECSVVCHHDFGPNNAIFVADRPIGVIDFDLSSPGEPLEDIGYMAWAWCVSSKASRPAVEVQAHQVSVLVEAYGGADAVVRDGLVDAILERQERNAGFWSNVQRNATAVPTPAQKIAEIIDWSWQEQAYTRANRAHFEAALRR
jgi:hypothetical protein